MESFFLNSRNGCVWTTLLAVFAIVVVGCGGNDFSTAPVSGTVTLDGKPFKTGQIMLSPIAPPGELLAGPVAIGLTDDAGQFTLGAYSSSDGAVIGPNRVTVINAAEGENLMFERIVLPQKPFEVVAGEENILTIELTKEMIARYATR